MVGMNRLGLIACLWILGTYAGALLLPIGGDAQDSPPGGDLEGLQTRVAQLEVFQQFVGPLLLPPPDPAPTYAANTIRFNRGYGFRLYCSIHDTGVMNGVYALDCARVDPANDPLADR